MSSHKCMACNCGIVDKPYDHHCQYCGGSGWIYDDYDIPYHPIASKLPTLPEDNPYDNL